MSYLPFPGRRTRRALFALMLASVAVPSVAQYPGGAIVQALPNADDPAEKLAAALRTLAVTPRDLGALIEAGRDALTLGDPNAAVGFFGHASEVSPRDGRVKAGLGAALVQLEKPRDALRYFQEASALGVPDADLAEDRGLAYDLVGDPAHAQQDYRTELAARPDDDAARRRLALSQGISGDRAAAIATLDPLIRKRDIAAWRAQTFVLAMTGDARGANDITRIMLPQQQAMLQPFLERLATLSPGDKARAVHFGEMPAAGHSYSDTQLASIGTPPTYAPAPPRIVARPAPQPTPVIVAPAQRMASVLTPAPRPAPTPAVVASLAESPRPDAGRERFVSASGVPMRRIEHSPQEMLALGMPRYEYVPMTDSVPSPVADTHRPAPAIVVAATPPIAAARGTATFPVAPPRSGVAMVAPSPAPGPAILATGSSGPSASGETVAAATVPSGALMSSPVPARIAGPATAMPSQTAMITAAGSSARPLPAVTAAPIPESSVAPAPSLPRAGVADATPGPNLGPTFVGPPAPVVAAASVPSPVPASAGTDIAMPLGASGVGGHFDVPHEIADRRPVARIEQPTARPPDVAAAHSAPPPVVAASPPEPSAVNPTVATARRARDGGGTEIAALDRSVRVGHGRATIAPADDGAASSMRKATDGKHGRETDKTASVADEDIPTDRKGRHGDHARTSARDADADSGVSGKSHGKDKADTDRKHGEETMGNDRPAKEKADKTSGTPKLYVQVAGGANKADMDKAWAGVKAKAPDLMKGHTPSTTPLRATNRLLVGPFKDEDEAQAFVNKMAGKGLSGFTFKSGKGQKVEKVDTAK